MLLTPHFALEEFTRTHHKVDNTPPPDAITHLRRVAKDLETLRLIFGPIYITSGYRGPVLNALVKGVPSSAHCFGCAADFHTSSQHTVKEVWDWLWRCGLQYDQTIWEIHPPDQPGGEDVHWLHYGIARPGYGAPRRMHFKIDKR